MAKRYGHDLDGRGLLYTKIRLRWIEPVGQWKLDAMLGHVYDEPSAPKLPNPNELKKARRNA